MVADHDRTPVGEGRAACACERVHERTDFIVLTGGPGAGKTAVLNVARQHLCRHVHILDEAASILFGGGFPRRRDDPAVRAAQRAIYCVQRQLEVLAHAEPNICVALCDRGTIDGLAYWPGSHAEYFDELGTDLESEIARYAAVIHLRVPPQDHYPTDNPLRVESFEQAKEIDARILDVWSSHPRRRVIEGTEKFLVKARMALEMIEAHIPECCRRVIDDAQAPT